MFALFQANPSLASEKSLGRNEKRKNKARELLKIARRSIEVDFTSACVPAYLSSWSVACIGALFHARVFKCKGNIDRLIAWLKGSSDSLWQRRSISSLSYLAELAERTQLRFRISGILQIRLFFIARPQWDFISVSLQLNQPTIHSITSLHTRTRISNIRI